MKNVDRLAKLITKNKPENILIHSIPQTQNWIIAQKTNTSEWSMTLCNPIKNVTYNLGIISHGEHINLWQELIKLEINNKINNIKLAQNLRQTMKNFMQRNNLKYKRFTKIK